MIEHTFSA